MTLGTNTASSSNNKHGITAQHLFLRSFMLSFANGRLCFSFSCFIEIVRIYCSWLGVLERSNISLFTLVHFARLDILYVFEYLMYSIQAVQCYKTKRYPKYFFFNFLLCTLFNIVDKNCSLSKISVSPPVTYFFFFWCWLERFTMYEPKSMSTCWQSTKN